MTGVDEDWQRLLDALGTLGQVTETSRGVVVALESRSVEIVMTAEDWDDMPVTWGGYPIEETLELVRSQPGDMDFLVYNGQYELVPSETLGFSRSASWDRLVDRAKRYPDGVIPGMGWFAHRPDETS